MRVVSATAIVALAVSILIGSFYGGAGRTHAEATPEGLIGGTTSVDLPYRFNNGTIADANQVNANFDTLKSAIEDLAAEVNTLRTRLEIVELATAGDPVIALTRPTIIIGSAGTLEVYLATGSEVAGLEATISFPPNIQISECEENPEIGKSNSAFSYRSPNGNCTAGVDCTQVKAIIIDLSFPIEVIPPGSLLYTCRIDVAFALGTFPILCTDPGASTAEGFALETRCLDGAITVVNN